MHRHLKIWKFILNSLQQNVSVMLLYVLESNGSSPGRQGFFMGINAKHEMEGSIGGGIMEYKFVETAKDKLKEDITETILKKQFHDKSAPSNQSGMICSGDQTVLIYKVQKSDTYAIEDIVQCLELNKTGCLELTIGGIQYHPDEPATTYDYTFYDEINWVYREKIGWQNHLYVIGAGHCSLPFCNLMSMLNFYVHLYDDRGNLKTFEENRYAHEKVVVESYTQLENIIPSDENAYVVIMTFGYRTDDIALRSLINKKFKYLGMLGSKTKIEKMFGQYALEGIANGLLSHIYAPVGLQIKSETPEEIAVSIAAEIIAVKNKST